MSKGNMLLGMARGSVGDLTFYRRNAQQVTRARSRVVKNPKTLAQQMQRAIMRTSVEAYKVIKEICDHSFEGVSYGANSYAKFQALNMAMLRAEAAAGGRDTKSYLPSGFNGLVAMPWVLSKGSIAWVGSAISFPSNSCSINFDAYFPADMSVSQLTGITYQNFCDAFGLQQGDQVTLIAFPKRSDIDESACLEPVIARVILSPSAGFDMTAQMFTASGGIEHANPLNENTSAFTFAFQTGRLMANFAGACVGGACIISRRAADGSWKRSSVIMAVNSSERDGGYTLRQASMVAASEIVTESDWYLNNANEITE